MSFFRKSIIDPNELSRKIIYHIANSGFKLWAQKDFRELISFNNISKTEQDRIFNELEVTGLGLLNFYLDYILTQVEFTDHQIKITNLQKLSIDNFINWLKELNIADEFIKIWKKLINLRFKEYQDRYLLAFKESSYWKEFYGEKREFRDIWARIETMAICSWQHIRRGKTKKEDPLWRMLRKWLVKLDIEIARIIKDSKLLAS